MPRHLVTNNDWVGRIAEVVKRAGYCGLDIESYPHPQYRHLNDGKFALDPHRNKMRCVQIATDEHSWLVDFHRVTNVEPLKEILRDRSIVKIIQNSKFESVNFLKHWGVYPENVFDTFLVSRMFQPYRKRQKGVPPMSHTLGAIVERFLGEKMDKEEQLSDWADPELRESQKVYAFRDAEVLVRLYKKLKQMVRYHSMDEAVRIEMDAVLPISEMELHGVSVNREMFTQIGDLLREKIRALEEYIVEELPSPQLGLWSKKRMVNLDSNDDLRDALSRRFHELMQNFEVAIDADDWERLVEEGKIIMHPDQWSPDEGDFTDYDQPGMERPPFDFVEANKEYLLEFRKYYPRLIDALVDRSALRQMLRTYCDPIDKYIHPVTGRIHASLKQLGQWTHRVAANYPNVYNIPRPNTLGPGVKGAIFSPSFHMPHSLREAFVPEEGYTFSIVDFSQNQSRIVAGLSGCKALIEEFQKTDADVYKRAASDNLKLDYDSIKKDDPTRQGAKQWVLAYFFMVGARRYRQQRLERTREDADLAQCQFERNRFLYETYPELSMWHRASIRFAQENMFTTTHTGRKVFFHESVEPYTEATNFPVATREVDEAKNSGGEISRIIRREGYDARPVLFVYDEWVYSVREDQGKEFLEMQKRVMKEKMQRAMVRGVRAEVEGGFGPTWASK